MNLFIVFFSMKIIDKIKANIPTKHGKFSTIIYRFEGQKEEHLALVKGDVKNQNNVFLRIHSECFTGDIFGSLRCDCGDQLQNALKSIAELKNGLIVYLRQEGRGIGLFNKLRAYDLQDKEGYNTYDANEKLGYPADSRKYDIASEIIKDLEIKSIILNTNNPQKIQELKDQGINISKTIPAIAPINQYNQKYLETKKEKLKHLL